MAPARPRVPSASQPLRALDEYDVVLIDAVECLDLQADRASYLCLEFAEGGRFLIEQAIDDVLMGQYQQLAAGKLPALSHNLAKDLVTDGFRRADKPLPFAGRTRPAQQVLEALARALAGHLH